MRPSAAISKTLETKVARVARRLRKTPRLVLREAIDEYVARHDPEAVTQAMNRVADVVDTRSDPAVAGAARRTLERTEWFSRRRGRATDGVHETMTRGR